MLLTPDGEVLVAASEPTVSGQPTSPGRGLERGIARERTLQRATFNPPGSVLKPFVAAYALEHGVVDPSATFPCVPEAGASYGRYLSMRCTGLHWQPDLHAALAGSCNCYFAQLGERMEPDALLGMTALFGFGQPTGIRHLGTDGRSGLREDWAFALSNEALIEKLVDRGPRMQFTNGLGLIEATPMQIARATAGLLTGRLPEIRIARSIGGEPVEPRAEDLRLREEVRRRVLDALVAVVEEDGGTANDKGLDARSLGFTFACKTGSADYDDFSDGPDASEADRRVAAEGKMRKHTWVAGWFPRVEPRAVLVVYLHDTSATASHGAVYVAGQFLRTKAVRDFVERGSREAAR